MGVMTDRDLKQELGQIGRNFLTPLFDDFQNPLNAFWEIFVCEERKEIIRSDSSISIPQASNAHSSPLHARR